MATNRERCGKLQAIIRHKNIGTQARTFVKKTSAIKQVLEKEKRLDIEALGLILLSEITLGQPLLDTLRKSPRCQNRKKKQTGLAFKVGFIEDKITQRGNTIILAH